MLKTMVAVAICIMTFAMSAAAQTGTVPLFSGSTYSGPSTITESGGNVGIGATNPQILEVAPAPGAYNAAVGLQSDISGAIAVAREGGRPTWNTYMPFYTNNVIGGNVLHVQENIRIAGNGNVGISATGQPNSAPNTFLLTGNVGGGAKSLS